LSPILLLFFIARFTSVSASTVNEDEFATFTVFDSQFSLTSFIFACKILSGCKVSIVYLVEAVVTGHEVEWIFTEVALPGSTFITLVWRKTLGFLALVADYIAGIEATFTAADGSHTILDKVHETCTFKAKEVVQFIGTLLTLYMLKQLEWEFVAEYEEVSVA
jgi:hypothetical protein